MMKNNYLLVHNRCDIIYGSDFKLNFKLRIIALHKKGSSKSFLSNSVIATPTKTRKASDAGN